ncbi:LOW QUALITY PROTEIN: hypothetical protein HZS_7439 [Henneguya salminicola]|nr:LOW QUALITY PROTEIN: hypothetical protein HZS_7439 [Henneguya salminicola]
MKLRALQEKIISQELTLQYLRDQGLISISQRCPKYRNQMILRKTKNLQTEKNNFVINVPAEHRVR